MPVTPVAIGRRRHGRRRRHAGRIELMPRASKMRPRSRTSRKFRTRSAPSPSAVSNRTAILSDEQIDVGIEPTAGTGGDNRTPGFGGGRGGGIGGGIGSGFGPVDGGPPASLAAKSASSRPTCSNTPSGSTFSRSSSAC